MNNILNSLKRFIKNKNTITIIGVFVILGILYWGYDSQIKAAVNPVQVPVAAISIQPRIEIKDHMLKLIEMPAVAVPENVVRSRASIVGKWTNVNAVIPEGSMFYINVLVDKNKLPDSAFVEVKEGQIPYQFRVDINSTYGNSIFPGNKIDIYMKANDDDGKIMVGKLLENVEVLAVKDSSGKHVFENTEQERTPTNIIFGIEEEIHILLRKAGYMTRFGVELFPVPHGGLIESEGDTRVSTQYLKDYINANTVVLEGQESQIPTDEDLLPDEGE
ncbi:MAG: hypothetical protein PHO63_00480 [Bacilli bacterium]|nr:hypothetical protein [Bacilli bacterium]MDD4809211.1 hypothetical protein [Bacilli bacterium]